MHTHWYVTSDLTRAASVSDAIALAGVSVQLRALGEDSALVEIGKRLRAITRAAGVRLVLNRRVDLARAIDADGIHTDPDQVASVRVRWPSASITAPCHDDAAVRVACQAGADEVFVSPIFATPGKGEPRGLVALEAARAIVDEVARQTKRRTRVVALGGITVERAAQCLRHGADGVAAIRLFEAAGDPGAVARALRGTA